MGVSFRGWCSSLPAHELRGVVWTLCVCGFFCVFFFGGGVVLGRLFLFFQKPGPSSSHWNAQYMATAPKDAMLRSYCEPREPQWWLLTGQFKMNPHRVS